MEDDVELRAVLDKMASTDAMRCPICEGTATLAPEGTGWVMTQKTKCPACRGRGTVSITRQLREIRNNPRALIDPRDLQAFALLWYTHSDRGSAAYKILLGTISLPNRIYEARCILATCKQKQIPYAMRWSQLAAEAMLVLGKVEVPAGCQYNEIKNEFGAWCAGCGGVKAQHVC